MMSADDKDLLEKATSKLTESLDVEGSDLLAQLRKRNALDAKDEEIVKEECGAEKQVKRLIHFLRNGKASALDMFIHALRALKKGDLAEECLRSPKRPDPCSADAELVVEARIESVEFAAEPEPPARPTEVSPASELSHCQESTAPAPLAVEESPGAAGDVPLSPQQKLENKKDECCEELYQQIQRELLIAVLVNPNMSVDAKRRKIDWMSEDNVQHTIQEEMQNSQQEPDVSGNGKPEKEVSSRKSKKTDNSKKTKVLFWMQFAKLQALESIWAKARSGALTKAFRRQFVTPQFLEKVRLKSIKVTVDISEEEYLQCRSKLLAKGGDEEQDVKETASGWTEAMSWLPSSPLSGGDEENEPPGAASSSEADCS